MCQQNTHVQAVHLMKGNKSINRSIDWCHCTMASSITILGLSTRQVGVLSHPTFTALHKVCKHTSLREVHTGQDMQWESTVLHLRM